ncbi:PVC-type heme-binding CxxCH protein [Calycomorphotria hydatis]|nr:PVC-type heme-binding CxxCH protein [Calycomorphotria hydatis]
MLLQVNCLLAAEGQLRVLFLGDAGHHQPAEKADYISPLLARRGIDVIYTENPDDLNRTNLSHFDALVVFANIDEISPSQEKALLNYVAEGGGFIPLHCASYCFRNSDQVVDLIGGQFLRHGTGEFQAELADVDHEILKGYGGFKSWDETYIHHKHNEQNRTVLEYRTSGDQQAGHSREPWTWVRTHDKGRVFYTAWGHDMRTWQQPGFQNLLERGIRWAAGKPVDVVKDYVSEAAFSAPEMTSLPENLKKFGYQDVGAKIPNYTPSKKWGVQGDNLTKMQLPLPAEESLKHYVVPEGFQLSLFASEPQLGAKPIAMCWDKHGRLVVCETVDYPNELAVQGEGRDRIEICEDTDGDGRADKFTVFADKLSIPTSVVAWRDGFLVQTDGNTVFMKDTDGDDVADVRKVLISGWNMKDTHGCVSNFQYGLDNWIWAIQGYNNSSPVANGVKYPAFRMGFFRFRLSDGDDPVVEEIEFVRSTNNNSWGIGISEEGIIFGSTANGNPSVYMPLPNRYYERVYGMAAKQSRAMASTHRFSPITENIRQVDHHGGYTAAAGHALYTARNYPESWWNRTAFVCGPTGHLVGTYVIKPNGSDFSSELKFNMAASDDEWSAPIVAEVGPDGNVWMIDWYNYIVQHNPTPHGFETGKGAAYETDLRDKLHGRIYRLHYVGDGSLDQSYQSSKYLPNNEQELVEALTSPTMLVRKFAQQEIIERKLTSLKDDLLTLLTNNDVDEIGLNAGAIHTIWTLDGLGLLSDQHEDVATSVLNATRHDSAGVRRNAYLALIAAPKHLSQAVSDFDWLSEDSGQVRLAVLQSAADLSAQDAVGEKLAGLLSDKSIRLDEWQRDAATSACAVNAKPFLSALFQQCSSDDSRAGSVVNEYGDLIRLVSRSYIRGAAQLPELNDVFIAVTQAPAGLQSLVLSGFVEAWPKSQQANLQSATEQELRKLFERSDADNRDILFRLANAMGASIFNDYKKEMVADYLAKVEDEDASNSSRVAAARDLVRLQPDSEEVAEEILALITPRLTPDFARDLLNTLADCRAENLSEELLDRQEGYSPALRSQMIDILLRKSEFVPDLLDAFEGRLLALSDLTIEQKQRLSNLPDQQIRERALELLKAGGGLPNPDRARVIEDLHYLAEMKGHVEAGKIAFTKHCAKCHQHGDLGMSVGPNLTGMAVHPKKELLVHILDPNRDVEGNFRTYTILDEDGRVFTGMLASESRTTLEIIDTAGKKTMLQRDQIEEFITSRQSLMPEGFEKNMKPEEIRDVLEFLTTKGKYLPLDLRKVCTTSTYKDMFYPNDSFGGRLMFNEWKTLKHKGIPFDLIDPAGGRTRNALMLRGAYGEYPPQMPESIKIPTGTSAKAVHILGGISGWGYPATKSNETVMKLRVHYEDDTHEDHEFRNGIHIADYIRRIDVPESEFVTELVGGQQVRYHSVQLHDSKKITELEFLKQDGSSCPIILAVTVETLY